MKFKKIVSLLIVMSVMLSTAAFANDEEKTSKSIVTGKYELLRVLDIITDVTNNDETVKRAEFIKYLCQASGIGDASGVYYVGNYKDVNKSNEYAPYIQMMTDLFVISGNGEGYFEPDSPILFCDAVALCCKLTGNNIYAESKGGYPSGYMLAAAEAGITKGISLNIYEELDGENLLKILYNLLNTEIVAQKNFGNNDSVVLEKDKTILESVFSVYEGKGIVMENDMTALDDESSLGKNYIKIDKDVFYSNKTDNNDLLGLKIHYFYKDSNENEHGKEIIWCEKDLKNDNNEIIVAGSDIVSSDNYEFKYENKYDKLQTLKFNGNSNVIYNKKAYPGYKFSDLIPKMGSVTLIDADNDNTYETIKVISYTEFSVEGVSYNEDTIFLKNTKPLKLKEFTDGYKIYRENKEATIGDISGDDVITACISKDKKYAEIYIGFLAVTGTVKGFNTDDKNKIVTIDDKTYPLSPLSEYAPQIDDFGTFYFDCFGNIFYKDIQTTKEQYGYLMKIGYKETYEKEYKFKILTPRGIVVFKPADRIKLNDDAEVAPGEFVEKTKLYENGVLNGAKKTEQQLIKYKTNAKGEINLIKTYIDNTNPDERKTKDDDRFTFDAKAGENGVWYRGGNARIMGTKYLINAKTAVFTVPDKFSSNDDDFKAHNIAYFKSENNYKGVEFYGVNYLNVTDAVVVKASSEIADKIISYSYDVIVESITEYYSKEKELNGFKLSGVCNGNRVEYYVFNYDLADNDERYGNGIKFTEIETGDVIQVAYDDENVVDQMKLLYRAKDGLGYKISVDESLGYMHMGCHACQGKIIARTEDTFVINCKGEGKDYYEWDRTFSNTNYTHFYEVDRVKKKVKEISPYDINEGDFAFIRSSYSVLYDLVVYKN